MKREKKLLPKGNQFELVSCALCLLLLCSCASNKSLIANNKFSTGMSKTDVCYQLVTSGKVLDWSHICGWSKKQEYFPGSNMELLSTATGSLHFLFHNVSKPMSESGMQYGDGQLVGVFTAKETALRALSKEAPQMPRTSPPILSNKDQLLDNQEKNISLGKEEPNSTFSSLSTYRVGAEQEPDTRADSDVGPYEIRDTSGDGKRATKWEPFQNPRIKASAEEEEIVQLQRKIAILERQAERQAAIERDEREYERQEQMWNAVLGLVHDYKDRKNRKAVRRNYQALAKEIAQTRSQLAALRAQVSMKKLQNIYQ